MKILDKFLGRDAPGWVIASENLPDFGLSRIEMKLLATLVVIQVALLALMLL